jgi:cell volume regulation protein A
MLAGRILITLIRKISFDYEGLYPVLSIAMIILTYGITAYLNGSGFLAVYAAGLMLGKTDFAHKRVLMNFHEGVAWLMQIAMFVVLGLLVFPSQLPGVALAGLAISFTLIFISRPVSIFACLPGSPLSLSQKVLVSWVGLRGAVPVVLATFPLLAGVGQAHTIFNLVFFVVITSTVVQGPTIPLLAGWLGLDVKVPHKPKSPLEFEKTEKTKTELLDIMIPKGSAVIGKELKDLALPEGVLVVLINRGEDYIVPKGTTELQEADILFALVEYGAAKALNAIIDEGVKKE